MEAWTNTSISEYTNGQIRIKVARLKSKAIEGLTKSEREYLAQLKLEALNRGLRDIT